MCPSTSRKSHGQSSFTSIMPHGGFYQRADLVQHLSPHHIQSPSVHSAHPLCWQSSDLWWQTPYRNGTLWSPSWRWFLWKTHHSWDWTGPRISGIHGRNQAFGGDLSRSNQYLSSSLTLFRFSSCRSSERLSLTLPYCHQGCVPSLSCSTRFDPVNSFVLPSWASQGGTPDNFRPTLNSASELPIAVQNKGSACTTLCGVVFLLGFLCCVGFLLVFLVLVSFFLAFSLLCLLLLVLWCLFPFVLLVVSWLNLRSLLPSCGTFPLMDHAQARAFHHHLARALMHLNYLAGLLPFFEPSIEWEDSLPPQNLRLDNMRSRSLHTFVPLPPSSAPPTMVTHGGIPSHMVENPEPNLRPTTFRPPSHMEREHPSINLAGTHGPVLMTDPNPNPDNPSCLPSGREISRNTIPVPVRSKQRVSSTFDPQPKKRQKTSNPPDTPVSRENDTSTPAPLPISSNARINELNSDDSDGDGASTAASVHEPDPHPAPRDESTSHITIPPGTSAITLTPNPKAPASPPSRNIPPTHMDPPRAPPFRPWTTADDQKLMSMKQDTKSRPSWKSIGARLHRDPQVCKLRWGILKQSLGTFDHPSRANPTLDHEADD